MDLFRLVYRNCLRHPLRSGLTIVGVAIALLSFCMIRTMIDAWYVGVKASAKNRLVTRNAASLVFSLPVSYRDKIAKVPGVELVGYGNWFGGIYQDERQHFAQFAVDSNYIDIYPEFLLTPEEREAFRRDRRGAIAGQDIATKYGWKIGDTIPIKGTIYPGSWEFVLQGIYKGRDPSTVTRSLLYNWEYLNESNKVTNAKPPDSVGFYVIRIAADADPATVSKAVDDLFANSYAETLTETETAFQQGFVSMSSTIIGAMDIISVIVILIFLLILANTMVMTARERYRDYAIMKTLGFRAGHLGALVCGEALFLALLGFVLFSLLLIPVFGMSAKFVLGELSNFFPVFALNPVILAGSFFIAVLVGVAAGVGPLRTVLRTKVADGLRRLG